MKNWTPHCLMARFFSPARSTRRAKATMRPTTPAEVDVLEARELLTASLANGVLTIQGNPGDYAPTSPGAFVQVYVDVFRPSQIVVREGESNVKLQSFPADKINQIVFNGTDEKDYFSNSTSKELEANGKKGSDVLLGGTGRNTMNGGYGDDTIDMRNGAGGIVNCGPDNDTVLGGNRALEVNGGTGNDTIWGSSKGDKLYGGADQDLIYGQDGKDFIDGGAGNDVLFDGLGSDTLIGGAGLDKVFISDNDGSEDYASTTDEASLQSESSWRAYFRRKNLIFNGWIVE